MSEETLRVSNVRAPLKTHRAASGEKIFRQSKQKAARIVDPIRRIFVTNDGKDSADSLCEGFLEMPLIIMDKTEGFAPQLARKGKFHTRSVFHTAGISRALAHFTWVYRRAINPNLITVPLTTESKAPATWRGLSV